ncbi:MAG TPA: hypothetical protein VHD83_09650 [Puia sp.]|nr:hypothetical protein [Puia sp.]
MRRLLIIPVVLLCQGLLCSGVTPQFSSVAPEFINPTGTYTLTGHVRRNHVVGHSGEIRVELLDSGRIAIACYFNRGYPNYEAGSIIDTLPYDENLARYHPSCDSTCTIIFRFYPRTVELMGLYDNPRASCGFATGVIAAAVYEKTSWDRPVIQDLSAHGNVH